MLKRRILLLLWALPVAAQTTLFVSPNTREHLDHECARESQSSFEQKNFLAVSRRLADKLCPAAKVIAAEGIFAEEGENGGVISGCKPAAGRYVGSLLGTLYHQKWFLLFTPDANGKAELLTIALSNVGRQQILAAF